MFLDIHVQAGGTFVQDVPEEYNGFAYVWRGTGSFTEERISVEMGMVRKQIFHTNTKFKCAIIPENNHTSPASRKGFFLRPPHPSGNSN